MEVERLDTMPNAQVASQNASLPWLWWGIALVAVILDQASKHLAQAFLEFGQPYIITSFFNFQLRYNPGAAFSFLADHDGWQRWFFAVIATAVSVVLAVWIQRSHKVPGKTLEVLALSLILGGALGNLYDRIMLGHVVDFIVFHYGEHEWPAFNIADSAICLGAASLVLDMLKGTKKAHD